jgi:hypothetical protein
MPQTRPAETSNGVSLSDKLTREVSAFVSENGAIDACLSNIAFESPPDPQRVAFPRSQDKLLSGAAEQFGIAPIGISPAAIVPVEEPLRNCVAVLCDPPNWFINFQSSPPPEIVPIP